MNKPRNIEHNGRKIELIGATNKVLVSIDGRLYRSEHRFSSLRAARIAAISYINRHQVAA